MVYKCHWKILEVEIQHSAVNWQFDNMIKVWIFGGGGAHTHTHTHTDILFYIYENMIPQTCVSFYNTNNC